MNDEEREVMNFLIEAHNKYTKLPRTHPSDIYEWTQAIHRLQDLLSARIVRRDYPNDFISINS